MKGDLLFSDKGFDVQVFRSSGKGGQHANKVSTAVRITHGASGAIGKSTKLKSQKQNKRLAFSRLVETAKYKMWVARRAFEIGAGKTLEQLVDEQLLPHKLKTEFKDKDGRWVEEAEDGV